MNQLKEMLKSGHFGNVELEAQKKIREDITKRWNRIGLLEGLDKQSAATVATLYENQCKHLLFEATSADNSGSFETVVFPMIRRVFNRLLANDIVSVQAMNLPIGKLFFIRPVTSERKASFEWDDENGYTFKGGETLSHYGLMGYERQDMNQNGAQDNRYYLPDEVVNAVGTTGPVEQYVYNGMNVVIRDGKIIAIPSLTVIAASETQPATAQEGDTYTTLTFDSTNNVVTTTTYTYTSGAWVAGTPVNTNVTYTGKGIVEPQVTQYMKKSLYDLFYNDFLYDHSRGKVTICVGTATPVKIMPNGSEMGITAFPVSPIDGSLRNLMISVSGFNAYNAGRLTGPDGNEMDAETFLASMKVVYNGNGISDSGNGYAEFKKGDEIHFRVVTQKYAEALVHYNDICTADGRIIIELDLSKPAINGNTVDGYIGVDPTYASGANMISMSDLLITWAQYDSLELETEMGEVSFQIESVTVSVTERKLRATWSTELAQDVAAFHNVDAESELTALLSEQVGSEIDREILRDLRKAAPWQARWDYYGWQRQPVQSTIYTQKDWNQTLMTKINQISAQIQKSTLRGGADWIIVSSEISALLNDLEYFHVTDASAESINYNMGIEQVGKLQGRYNVIVDPYAPYYSLIMGHHGTSMLDTGYIYAPYIPVALTPTMFNPFNGAPIKMLATRYAKKIINNRYFGAIRVDGLVHYDIAELR